LPGRLTQIMTNWQFFQTLTTQLIAALQGATNGMVNGAVGYARPVVPAAAVAWLAFQAIAVAHQAASVRSMVHGLIRMAVVIFLIQTVANYNQYVGTVAQTIPTQVGNALAAGGANTGNVGNGTAFDTVSNAAIKAALTTYEAIPAFSLSSIPLWIAVIGFIGVAVLAVTISYAVYLASTVLLMLLLAVGPLFVALFAFPQTQKFGAGWVAAVVSTIVTQILAIALLVLFVGVEQETIGRVTTGGVAANFIDAVVALVECAALMLLISTLVKQTPAIAQSIAGGVYQNMNNIVGGGGSAAVATTRGAVGAIAMGGRGVSAGVRATAARISQPTGKSLSGG
jgi:type IV secretory pathway VirB6-like protein